MTGLHESAQPTAPSNSDNQWLLALLTLPGMGPKRLSALLKTGSGKDVWERLITNGSIQVDGVGRDKVNTWRVAARNTQVADHWSALAELDMWVASRDEQKYPQRLRDDIEPPHIMFGLGRPIGSLPTVGIVGTRNCTSYGKRCAFEFGAALARAGVSVVSGLALGIDAAAHQGVLSVAPEHRAPPIGVVGSGLDVVYPLRNAKLWADVVKHGSLVSETAPGVGPQKWRFPARNRIIAALSDAVVVIESHEAGGSLSTVEEAQARDVPVGAVPGPITSNSSVGSNRLLLDGATPVLAVEDVLFMIGHSAPSTVSDTECVDEVSSVLFDALGWNPIQFDELCARVTLDPSQVATHLERLVGEELITRAGPWIERTR